MLGLPADVQEALRDRYRLDDELGHGGMAVVYRARDLRHPRDVAVKVFDPSFGPVVGADRFAQEIAIAATLQHPGIIPLLDSGRAGDLLYYIMPLVDGETLRARVEREAQLPVPEAIGIVREVAEALAYAHGRGVVHRDIKPENILLSSGRAMVADFGIARAISTEANTRLTERGLAVGTPEYMSPEQAAGTERVDGRSDIYALACVLYELLAGAPPFTGRTAQAILARHMQEPPPKLRVVRPAISPALEAAIERALAKVPADRYATATEFAAALDLAVSRPDVPVAKLSPAQRRMVAGAGLSVALAAAMMASARWWPAGGTDELRAAAAAADTSHYAVLPFERAAGVTATLGEEQLLHDALARWSGITVVDGFRVRDAIARTGNGPLSGAGARRVALQLGAGRYLRGEVSPIGDSLRLHAVLYDARNDNRVLREHSARLPGDLRGGDTVLARLADSLLFGGAGPGMRAASPNGTNSVPALQAYVRAFDAIERWDLAAADSALVAATAFDGRYAQAFLWLALVRSWRGADLATWQSAAARAAAGRERLAARDRTMSDAMLLLSRGDAPGACSLWRRLTIADRFDFVAWYGLGSCLGGDQAVVTDPASPSGWRFRSSYFRAAEAYARALELLPSMHRSLRDGSYESVRLLLKTSYTALRRGRGPPPENELFAASASWQGDTLAFIPWPLAVFTQPRATAPSQTLAVRHQRERFHAVAQAWVAEYPRSADALHALAISLDMLGDRSALDTLERARRLAATGDARLRTAGAAVWLRVKYGAPADQAMLRAAHQLADSLLREARPANASEVQLLASLAMLTGRAQLAATYAGDARLGAEWALPGPLVPVAGPLLVAATMGGPADTLRDLERRADSIIAVHQPAEERAELRGQWLARPATLALAQQYRFRSLAALAGRGDYLLDAEVALIRGDTAAVRRALDGIAQARRALPPAEVTFDGLFPEAWLFTAMRDDRAAARWLDPALTSLADAEPSAFEDIAAAGSLVQAMVLRAEVAQRVGDRATARQWARAVQTLWSRADDVLQPVVRRMQHVGG